jgi:hypothetical protein
MLSPILKRRLLWIAIVTTFLVVVTFGYVFVSLTRASIPVALGYELFRADSTSVVLCDPQGSVVISDQIDLIGVSGIHIVGRVAGPGKYSYSGVSAPVGYFVLDVTTGNYVSRLTESQLLERLGAAPQLYSPSLWALWHW